jgi:hypothetical protein
MPASQSTITKPLSFVYFGQIVTGADFFVDGDFQLKQSDSNHSYYLKPYHKTNLAGKGEIFFNELLSYDYLGVATTIIRLTYYPNYSKFIATHAYAITWSFANGSNSTLVQVILCTDMKLSFMIVSYKELNVPADPDCCYFYDTNNHAYIFQASTMWSNRGLPGQFVFQFNTLEKQQEHQMIGSY